MNLKQKIITIILLLFVAGGSFFYWKGKWQPNKTKPTEKQSIINNNNNNNHSVQSDVYTTPIAVVIDNFPETRPQSGLSKADIVYETVTEGGITRFLAVYKSGKAENIGPIRSARTYFAELANELGAVFAHVGGNSDVLANLKSNQYKNLINLDQFFWENYFKRISSIKMPHNVFSSTEMINGFLKEQTKNIKQFQGLLVQESFLGQTPASKIVIDFLLNDYLVEYKYNQEKKYYERYLAGKPHIDASSKKVLNAQNVIVRFVKTWGTKSDTPYSISMDLESGGNAAVFAEGKVIEGVWKKTDRTRYYNNQNQEISIVPGKIWIELVPEDRKNYVKWE